MYPSLPPALHEEGCHAAMEDSLFIFMNLVAFMSSALQVSSILEDNPISRGNQFRSFHVPLQKERNGHFCRKGPDCFVYNHPQSLSAHVSWRTLANMDIAQG